MPEPTLEELLRGKGAHADPVACVEDLSAQSAGKKIAGLAHSIWQILGHMSYWMDYELRRIAGEKPAYPSHASASWPASEGPANDAEWEHEVRRFESLLARLANLAESSSDVLDRPVEILHPSQSMRTSTVRAVLWQTLVHNSYHAGQIVMLRQCLGAWPARRGGDTW